MPPHCDALDGPVVKAALAALETGDVMQVLPFIDAAGEQELRDTFFLALEARDAGGVATVVVDRWFSETAVRLHRAGEGAPFTGLKPAGLDRGSVIPVAERALETGSSDELIALLNDTLAHEAKERFDVVMELRTHAEEGLPQARAYTSAMLGLQVWANTVATAVRSDPHASHAAYEGHEH
jgi:hypothetical protein